MIVCPRCGEPLANAPGKCVHCNFRPETIDGFAAWAPDLAQSFAGFSNESYAGLAEAEDANFWFVARNALILWAIDRYFPRFESLLEVGCGTGFVLSGIARRYPQARLTGSEVLTAGLAHAARRVPGAALLQMDARRCPFIQEFDVVAAFDVIEHVVEDEEILASLYRAARPGAGCLITVPQHAWLWSPVDEAAHHVRRYTAAELHRKIERAGFRILRSTSFVSLLLPALLLSRQTARRRPTKPGEGELRIHPALNRLLLGAMTTERWLIQRGLNLPVGGSRLVIAQKI